MLAFSASATTSLPFSEGFDEGTADARAPKHTWNFSTTSTSTYPKKWTYDSFVYFGSEKVLPRTGVGGFADIRYYTSSSEYTYDSLTSEWIELDEEAELDLGFSYYQVASNTTSTLTVQCSFDGHPFIDVYTTPIAGSTSEWKEVKTVINVPYGSGDVRLRFTAYNGEVGETVIFDEVSLTSPEAQQMVYPSSVTDFTSVYNAETHAIDLALTAPTHSHASLGDVRNEPLDHISKIVLSRSISYGEYEVIHEFENPTPGERLTYSDTDLSKGGSYFYRAVVYVDGLCDYGEYVDDSIMIGQKPTDVTNLTATSDKGNAPVTLTFTLPSVDDSGAQLTEPLGVNIRRYDFEEAGWDDLRSWTDMTPGTEIVCIDDNAVTGKSYEYKVVVEASGGSSYGVSTEIYVGLDQPMAPTNVVAEENDGKITVTWTAPEKGINNGYIDFEGMTYKVYRGNGYSDYSADLIATGITECSFTDETEFPVEQLVRYFVKANCNNFDGYSTSSNLVRVGDPEPLPYKEGFNTLDNTGNIIADHLSWSTTSSEVASDWSFAELAYFLMEGQVQPVSGRGLAYVYYGPYAQTVREDYLTSGKINLGDATSPEANFYVYVVPGYETSLAFEVSTDGKNFTTLHCEDYIESTLEEAGWVNVKCPLTDYLGQTIIVRFHAHKGETACSSAVDELTISDVNGVIETVAATDARILLNGRALTVAAENADITVATIDGKVILTARNNAATTLNPGIYVVKAGNSTRKLIVK